MDESQKTEPLVRYDLIAGAILIALLAAAKTYSYLLFHSLAEIFSIVVAGSIFITAWTSRRQIDNHAVLFLGTAYLFVGFIDLLHTLAYRGMGVFPAGGTNLPTQLWIAGRFLESAALVIAPFFAARRIRESVLLPILGIITGLLLASILYWNLFPVCFVEGKGLTLFKVRSEYLICALLAGSGVGLAVQRRFFDSNVLSYLLLSVLSTIASELVFTLYAGPYDFYNASGHFLKIISFYFIYRSIFETSVRQPSKILFRGLSQSAEAYREERDRLYSILDSMADAVCIVNADYGIEYVNPAMEKEYGAQWKNLRCHQYTVGIEHPCASCKRNQVLAGSRQRHVLKTNQGKAYDVIETPLHNHDGSVSNLKIYRDVTEIERTQERLRAALDQQQRQAAELAQINEELESFSYSASHDLRNPLRVIAGFSEVLIQDFAQNLNEEGRDCLNRIQSATMRMDQLIQDLLNLARVSRHQLEPKALDLSAMARVCADELCKTQPGRKVSFRIQENMLHHVDGRLIRQVVENLMANAWKFSSRQTEAKIEFGRTEHDCRFIYFVRDNGAGFNPAAAARLFTPFVRLHTQSEFPGTGIGLAIVKRIVERHGGSVWAEGAVGQGATIHFALPKQISPK